MDIVICRNCKTKFLKYFLKDENMCPVLGCRGVCEGFKEQKDIKQEK